MSVCICILCGRDQDKIVFAEDRKVTFSDFSADNAVIKSGLLAKDWWIQYAGNDAEKAPTIISRARQKISSSPPDTWSDATMIDALTEAYWIVMQKDIEDKFLRKHGFTTASFTDHGKQKCTASVYNSICAKIDKYDISLEFLLAGFDLDGDAHLYVVDGKGEPRCYDDLGFWAIGSGAHAALSSLAFHVERGHLCAYCSCVHEAVYFACEAKFMAETSVHVGKELAFLSVHTQGQEITQFIFHDEMAAIKKKWLKQGAPRPNKRIIDGIRDLLLESPSERKPEVS